MNRQLALCSLALFPATVSAQLDWRLADLPPVASSSTPFGCHDPVRSRTVYRIGNRSDMWEWDGRFFHHITPPSSPSVGGSLAWDPITQRTVMLTNSTNPSNPPSTMWSWDGQVWTQLNPPLLPPSRAYFSLGTDFARSRVVLFGGNFNTNLLGDTWEWDGSTWTQSFPANAPSARETWALGWHAARGRVVLHGGATGTNQIAGDTWEWDGITWTLRATNGPMVHWGGFGPAPLGRMIVFGGQTTTAISGATWLWDGAAWSQVTASPAPAARHHAVITHDLVRDVAVLFYGGGGSVNDYNDMWEWDGTAWSRRHEGTPSLNEGVMAMDVQRGRAVAFGWFGNNAQTWEWDGSRWSRRGAGPSRRAQAAMCDQGNGRSLLFGGYGPPFGTPLSQSWTWNGSSWSQAQPTTSPPPRGEHAMAYDEARGEVVLFGGGTNSPVTWGDTWIWNGANWAQRLPATAPTPRTGHAMAYDPARAITVMYGGPNASETWEWDGSNWTLAPAAGGPAPLGLPLLVTAPDRQGVLLYGGRNLITQNTNTVLWHWDGVAWAQRPLTRTPYADRNRGASDPVHGHVILYEESMLLDSPSHAGFLPFGLGCTGTAGRPELDVARDWPFLGNTIVLETRNVPPTAPVFLAMGFSADQHGTTPLPAMLTGYGMPRCMQYSSIEASVLLLASSGVATLNFPIPNDPGLVGVELYAQSLVVDGPANAAGLTASNGARLRIGAP